MSLSELYEVTQGWFYKPDLQALRIVAGVMKGHYLNLGDPTWLFVVAPPGSGKTTMSIMGATGLHQVQTLGDLSENTFLSGFYGHHTPGLLEKLGAVNQSGQTFATKGDAILLMKDFTSVLSMRREKRAAILAQLREIHDGLFRRDFGTGVTKLWQGKITVIAAVTPALDRHYSIFSTLGERFLQVRIDRPNSAEAGEWALRQQGQERKMNRAFREAMQTVFRNSPGAAPILEAGMQRRIASLAEFVAIGRTYVYRNSFGDREIEYVPQPEANTRLSKQLGGLARGIAALEGNSTVGNSEFGDVLRVGFDCIPDGRRRLLKAIIDGKDIESIRMPRTVRDRQLQELEALEVLRRNVMDFWELTDNTKRLLNTAGVPVAEAKPTDPKPTALANSLSGASHV